jgi:hypothetical protein
MVEWRRAEKKCDQATIRGGEWRSVRSREREAREGRGGCGRIRGRRIGRARGWVVGRWRRGGALGGFGLGAGGDGGLVWV